MVRMPWSKTDKETVFAYILKYQSENKEALPTGRQIGLIYGISQQQGNNYLKAYREKFKNIKNISYRYSK